MDPLEGACTRKRFRLREGVSLPGGIVRYVGEGQRHSSKERLGKALDMVLSEEQEPASPARNWVGILSAHPMATRFLCDILKRNRKLRQLIKDARPISLDDDGGQCPSVVVLDTVLADCGSTSNITQKVRAKFPGSKLVGLASCREEHVIELLQLGFSAVVQITDNFDCDIASAIGAVLSGSIWAPESAISDYSRRVRTALQMRLVGDRLLTARENQILESVLWGRSNKEIASNLAISERTVKFHVSNILSKVGAERRRELVRVFSWTSQT